MNIETNNAPDLLQTNSRARKQIPIAVFTVITIHVVLFLGLLCVAGCKQKAQANNTGVEVPIQSEKKQSQQAAADRAAEAPQELSVERLAASKPVTLPTPEKSVKKPHAEVAASQNSAPSGDSKIHVVKAGENLVKIAKLYKTTPQALKISNNLKNDVIRVGQKLHVG